MSVNATLPTLQYSVHQIHLWPQQGDQYKERGMAAEEFGAEEEFGLEEEEVSFDFEDEFDRLRQKTSRTSAVYDDLELEDELEDEESHGFLAQISPVQRLILLVLLLLDIVVIAIGTMAVFNLI